MSQHLQAIILQVAGPHEHVTAWVAHLGMKLHGDSHKKKLAVVFTVPLQLLVLAIKEALKASVVTHQLMDSCGVATKKSGRYSCYSNCDFSIQLHSVVCFDFMADGMYVSQSFLCLLLTRKLYKTHLVT